MPDAFKDLKVSDGRVTEIVIRRGEVLVCLQAWQNRAMTVTFEDVIGLEEFGAIAVDLSHVGESTDDPLIREACLRANESPDGYRCYSLFSAWADEPLPRIVAQRVVVTGAC